MKLKYADFRRKCQHPLLLAAGTLPLAVLLVGRVLPEAFSLLPIFPLVYVLLAWLCLLIPGRWRIAAAVVGTAVQFGVILLPVRQVEALFLLPAGYGALLFVALPVAGWSRDTELSPVWHVGGLLSHILLQIFTDAARRTGSALYEPVETLLLISFLFFIALSMMAINRRSLEMAAQSRVKVPLQMRRQNLVLTLGLLILATVLSAMPAIGAFLRKAWDGLIDTIKAVAGFFASLLSHGSGGSGGGNSNPVTGSFGAEEIGEPGLFQVILEKVFGLFALVAAALLVVYLVRRLMQVLRRVLSWLWQKLTLLGSAASKDYEDEITDTRDDAQYERTGLLKRFRDRLSRSDESRMTPSERVRYRYLRLRMKHTDWKDASTARENLSSHSAQLYERARYGGQMLTEEEAQQFREDTRRV